MMKSLSPSPFVVFVGNHRPKNLSSNAAINAVKFVVNTSRNVTFVVKRFDKRFLFTIVEHAWRLFVRVALMRSTMMIYTSNLFNHYSLKPHSILNVVRRKQSFLRNVIWVGMSSRVHLVQWQPSIVSAREHVIYTSSQHKILTVFFLLGTILSAWRSSFN